MTRGGWLAGLALLAGCVSAPSSPPPTVVSVPPAPLAPTPSSVLLARADRSLASGEYAQARQAYADFARQYPEDGAAPRVMAARDLLDTIAAAREEIGRMNGEILRMREQAQDADRDLDRLRRELGTRAAELTRVRQELGERQAELARQLAEVEALRADLEKLKSVDLRLERRR